MKTFEKILTIFSIVATFGLLVFVPAPSPELNEPLTDFITYALLLMGLGAFVIVTWTEAEPATEAEITREVPVTDFNTLDVWGVFNLLVTRGEVPRVTLRGRASQLNRIQVVQRGPALVLSSRFWLNGWWWRGPVFVSVTMPTLRLLDASGASQIRVDRFDAFTHTLFDLSGVSDVTFSGRGERLSVEASGASKLTLRGEAQRLDVDLSGACSLTAPDLTAADVNVELSGACSAQVHATAHLYADLSGASSLRYRGQPIVELQNSGASSVSRY
jgi:hypothetical protein